MILLRNHLFHTYQTHLSIVTPFISRLYGSAVTYFFTHYLCLEGRTQHLQAMWNKTPGLSFPRNNMKRCVRAHYIQLSRQPPAQWQQFSKTNSKQISVSYSLDCRRICWCRNLCFIFFRNGRGSSSAVFLTWLNHSSSSSKASKPYKAQLLYKHTHSKINHNWNW